MDHKVGDAVRLRPGSVYTELLEPRAGLTGSIAAVDADEQTVAVVHPDSLPGFTSSLPASEILPDAPIHASPF